MLVDTGFWAGLVPQNAYQPKVLRAMVAGGALGFKAFMSPSGIDDFDNVSPADIAAALPTIKSLGVPLLVHAELVDEDVPKGVRLFFLSTMYGCPVYSSVMGEPSGCSQRC